MKSPLLQFMLPGVLLGALGGYLLAGGAHRATTQQGKSPRERFLAVEDGIDYEKMARVCLAVSQRSDGDNLASIHVLKQDAVNPEQVQKTKEYLDRLMANALERGAWSRIIAFRARQLLGELPPDDAADFAQLFATAVQQGDLKVAPGAWVPEAIN